MKRDYPVRRLCLYLKASPSGFYEWEQRQAHPCARALENQSLAREIDRIHTRSRQTYGAPRIERELRKRGRCHGRNRVARLMKEKGLCGRQKRRYRVQTTDSNHGPTHCSQSFGSGPQGDRPQSALGGRHHLY